MSWEKPAWWWSRFKEPPSWLVVAFKVALSTCFEQLDGSQIMRGEDRILTRIQNNLEGPNTQIDSRVQEKHEVKQKP